MISFFKNKGDIVFAFCHSRVSHCISIGEVAIERHIIIQFTQKDGKGEEVEEEEE